MSDDWDSADRQTITPKENAWDYLFYSYKANLPLDKSFRSDLDKLHKAVNVIIESKLKEERSVGFVCDNCGSETASCLTLCPDCLKEKGVL